jgi:hypothetical protein
VELDAGAAEGPCILPAVTALAIQTWFADLTHPKSIPWWVGEGDRV